MLEDPIHSTGLTYIRNVTGLSRNHLADIFGYTPNSVARWENEHKLPIDAMGTYDQLYSDFNKASHQLDELALMWDEVIPVRQAAMKLGISPHTMQSMLARKRIAPFDFGLLGNFITVTDLAECRRP